MVVQLVADSAHTQVLNEEEPCCKEHMYTLEEEEGEPPSQTSFDEDLATFDEVRFLNLNSRDLSVVGVGDVSCEFLVGYMFSIEELCQELYGNACQPSCRHLRCRAR